MSLFACSASCVTNTHDFTKPFPLADVCFRVEGKLLYSVRAFLAMHSPYFERMFSSEWAAKKQKPKAKKPRYSNVVSELFGNDVPFAVSDDDDEVNAADARPESDPIPLPTKKFDDFLALLRLLKRSPEAVSVITDANIAVLLKMADEYDLPHVFAECGDYIVPRWSKKQDSFLEAVRLADKHGMERVLEMFVPRAAGRGFEEIQEYMPPKLSPEAYAVLLHSHLQKIYNRNAGSVASVCISSLPINMACANRNCNTGRPTFNRHCKCSDDAESEPLSEALMEIVSRKSSLGLKHKH